MRSLPPEGGGPATGAGPEPGRAKSPDGRARGGHRLFLLALGGFSVALGLLGLALPVLPTTPFLLLALWAFARSSRRLHDWLYHHPRFGPRLRLWDRHRVIPVGAKVAAVSTMAASLAGLILLSPAPWYALTAAAVLMGYGAWFILTKPSHAPP